MDSEITIIFAVGCYVAYVEYRLLELRRSAKKLNETLDVMCSIAKRTMK